MAVVMDPQMPTGTEVASYQTYAQARAAVDFLSDSGFDVSSRELARRHHGIPTPSSC